MSYSALYYTQNTLKLICVEAYNDISFPINVCVCLSVVLCMCVCVFTFSYEHWVPSLRIFLLFTFETGSLMGTKLDKAHGSMSFRKLPFSDTTGPRLQICPAISCFFI